MIYELIFSIVMASVFVFSVHCNKETKRMRSSGEISDEDLEEFENERRTW